jgi:hypothetical protein
VVSACVQTCHIGRTKIRAPKRTATQSTIVHVSAPRTTADASISEFKKEGVAIPVCWLPTIEKGPAF